jgi:hypothetical protein
MLEMHEAGHHQSFSSNVEAYYELSLLTAKAKKAHTIGQTLVKPCVLTAVNIVLGAKKQKKL